MHDRKDNGFHARRLMVAPPRRYRVRVGSVSRAGPLVLNLLDCSFVLLYVVLGARLVLMTMNGSISSILTRMLRPFSDRLITPLANFLPPVLPEPLHLLLPALVAMVTAVVLHWLLRRGVRRIVRLPPGRTTDSAVSLLYRLARSGERVRVRMVDAIREA